MIIRNAVESDAEDLIDYMDAISEESNFLTFGPGEFGANVQQEKSFIANLSTKKNTLFIVAEMDGKIIGNLSFSGGPRPRIAHVGEFGISVLKEYWGYGVGEELLQYLINWSKNSGIIRKINLKVRTDNTRGIHLYSKMGFLEEGLLKRDLMINGDFFDSLLMGLSID